MAGLSGRVELGAWFWIERGSCDLLLARSARIVFGLTRFFLWVVSCFSWLNILMGVFHSVSIVRDAGLILARRAVTWVRPFSRTDWMCCS